MNVNNMWSPRTLKVINSTENSLDLQELLADCQDVCFSPFSTNNELWLLGYWDSNLRIVSAANPEKAQLITFKYKISSCRWHSSEKLFVTFGTNEIAFITKLREEWSNPTYHAFSILGGKLVDCFPMSTGLLIFIKMHSCIIIGLSENIPEWKQVGKIDCIEDAVGSVQVTLSPLSKPNCLYLLIGTEDGHVYELKLEPTLSLTFLYDIQQPVSAILIVENQIVILGKYGKIAQLKVTSKEVSVSFAPTAVSGCLNFRRQLYLMGSEQLYSMELKCEGNDNTIGEPNYCKVNFVRAFHVDQQAVFILTENGTVYQSSLAFESAEVERKSQRNGTEIKPILLEIHRCSDQTKALNAVKQKVWHNVSQLSIALHMLGQGTANQFPVAIRSFADPISPRNQRLVISITNKSSWNLSASHWGLQLSALPSESTFIRLKQEWKIDEELELEHRLSHLNDEFDVQAKIALVFQIADPQNGVTESLDSFCVFPLANVELTVLDFLEPAVSQDFDMEVKQSELMGFSKTVTDSPWQLLLQQSWHRGFATWLSHPPPMKVIVRCGTYSVRMSLKEDASQTDKIWILRMEASNPKLLKLLSSHFFRLIEKRQPAPKCDVIRMPAHVSAHLQSLSGRLNYIQSLSDWDKSDIEPLMEEIHLFMAKHFYIR